MRRTVFAALLILFSFTHPLSANELPTLAPIIEEVRASVVGIETKIDREDEQHGTMREVTGFGSGFVIKSTGLVATAEHVIANVKKITIIFDDGRRVEGRVVESDKDLDIALLQVVSVKTELPPVVFANSDLIKNGDWTFAIGSPFGLVNSVSMGVISAKSRWGIEQPTPDGKVVRPPLAYIQTDAAVNPGNSGGPLFNLSGEVIGLVTFIISRSGASDSVGFAIPSNFVKFATEELHAYHRVRQGWWGVRGTFITEDNASLLGVPVNRGLLIRSLFPNGPADMSGFRAGDIVTSWNGKEVKNGQDFEIAFLYFSPVGSIAKIELLRNGVVMEILMTVKEAGIGR